MTDQLRKITQSTQRIYLWPLLINCICLLGLISALIGNGWLDLLSWLCLGGVVAFTVYVSFDAAENSDEGRL